jgi:hypothetical protein
MYSEGGRSPVNTFFNHTGSWYKADLVLCDLHVVLTHGCIGSIHKKKPAAFAASRPLDGVVNSTWGGFIFQKLEWNRTVNNICKKIVFISSKMCENDPFRFGTLNFPISLGDLNTFLF